MTDDKKPDTPASGADKASETTKKGGEHQTDQIGHKDIDHKDAGKKS